MDFFYNLNKKLNGIRELPETTHKQLNEGAAKKPDENEDGIPDYAQDGKGAKDLAKGKKPDYKSKMQDKFGGSASDLTKGLSIKSKKVNEGAHSVRDVLAYEIKMILDGAAAGDDQTDHIVDELGDIFNNIKASRDKTAMMAYEMMVDTIDEDATTQAVAARKALALLKNNSANMAESRIPLDQLTTDSDFDPADLMDGPELKQQVIDEIKMMMENAIDNGEVPIDDVFYDFGDIFNDVHVNGDDKLVNAYMLVRSIDDEDDVEAFVANCKKALAMLGASVVEGNYTKDAMELNPDFAKVGKKPGVMGKIAQGVKKVADFVVGDDEDIMRRYERETGGRRPTKEAAAPIDFDKVLDAIAALYGDDIWENDAMQDLANDLEQAGPTERELDFIIAKGKLPKRLANTQFSAGDNVRFGEGAAPMTPKQKSFAKLAPPENEITFADKIAGAKREVDEMLGDVAAEAMKSALGKRQVRGMGEATKEIPGGRRHTAGPGGYGRKDDEDAPKVQTQRGRGRPKKNADSETGQVMKPDWSAFGVGKVNLPKHKGAVTKHKMVGESPDQQQVQQIYNDLAEIRAAAKQAQRGGQFPQGFASQLESVLWSAMTLIQNQQPGDAQVREGADPKTWTTIEDVEFIEDLMDRAFEAGSNSLGNTLQGVLEVIKYNQDEDEPVNEKAVSKKQQRFMGMVHAAKKGEKPASKEVARAAKGISAKEADKFASTKHKGLPNKVKEEDTDTRDTRAEKAGKKVTKDIEYDERAKDGDHGKKRGPQDAKAEKAGKKVAKDIEHDEKVEETTVSGSVATAPAKGGKKSAGGFSFGQGVYEARLSESYNRQLNAMLNESMSINASMNNDADNRQSKSLTVTATDEDAEALSDILKMAGLFSSSGYTQVSRDGSSGCSECGMHGGVHEASCGHRDMVEEELANSANNTGYADTDTMVNKLSGGLNGPKLQVNPNNKGDNPLAMRDLGRSAHSLNLGRMMEMAGVNEQQLDEGVMDKIKGLVPRFMQMVGADTAAEIAKQVKQVTGGDYSLTQDNAVKVAKAFGLDKMQPPGGQGQQQMAEGIAGNWQGKLMQLVYTGLAGAGMFAGITGAGGPFAGRFVAVIGLLLLLFAHTFFSSDRGGVGAMGRHGNKGFETDKGPESLEENVELEAQKSLWNLYKGIK